MKKLGNIKKFLKVFIISVLVLAVIVGTCFFFFRKNKIKDNTTESLVKYFNSEKSVEFKNDIENISELVNSDGTDARINLIINTNNKLDLISDVLISYYVENGTKVNDEKIASSFRSLKSSKSKLISMMDEYEIKSGSAFFDRHLGANDFYIEASRYLIEYAKFSKSLNEELSVDRKADVKFNMFDVYANVVEKTFAGLNKDEKTTARVEVNNSGNLGILNNRMAIIDSTIQTSVPYGKDCRNFNEYYAKCDKTEFVTKLAQNLGTVTNADQDNNEKIATYYFKLILGL